MPIAMLREVAELVTPPRLRELSPSLRHSKYVSLDSGENKKDMGVIGAPSALPPRPPSLGTPDGEERVFRLRSRLIVNQAGGVLENANLCLDPHYGCPFIPGSAVKGVARHAAWLRWEETGDADLADRIARTFGFPTGDPQGLDQALGKRDPSAGAVVFFPAYPRDKPSLVLDIVNCHHHKYYSDDQIEIALDNENPIPNYFPAVEAGARFVFALAPTARLRRAPAEEREALMRFAWDCLKEALEDRGIGAKTAAGYGWFEEDAAAAEALREVKRKTEEERKEKEAEAAMSPEERLRKRFRAMENEEFANFAKSLAEHSEDEQKAFLSVLREKKDKWKTWKKRRESLAASLAALAKQRGIELP